MTAFQYDPDKFKEAYAGQLIAQASTPPATTGWTTVPNSSGTGTSTPGVTAPSAPGPTGTGGEMTGEVMPDFSNLSSLWGQLTPDERKATLSSGIMRQWGAEDRAREDERIEKERELVLRLINENRAAQQQAYWDTLPFKNKELQYKAMGQLFSRPANYQVTQIPVSLAPYQNVLYRVNPGMDMDIRRS